MEKSGRFLVEIRNALVFQVDIDSPVSSSFFFDFANANGADFTC